MKKAAPSVDTRDSDCSQSLADQISNRRKLLTADEVSEVLAVAKTTVYDWAKNGRLPSVRISGAVRFEPKDVADLLRKCRSVAA